VAAARGRSRAAGALAATAAALAAVLPPPSAAQDRADVVRIPFPQDDGSLTPYTFELGYPLMSLVYDTVMLRDERGIPRPWLARSVRRGEGGRRLTIRFRRGIRWHDGRPFSAADVAFTLRFVAERFHPRFTPQTAVVERAQAVAPLTLVMTLRTPSLGVRDQPLADVPILPRHLWEGLPPERLAPPGRPVGTGPYRLAAREREGGYRFRANRRYFRGRPLVETIRVPIIRRAEATLRAFQRGDVEMLPESLPEDRLRGAGGLATRIASGPSYDGTVLMFNLRAPPFDRASVRRAASQALDLERIADAVGAVPADRGYIHPRSTWAPSARPHRFDLPRARTTIAEAAVPRVEVLAPRSDPARLEAGEQAALALERAGMRARVRPLSARQLARAVGQDGSRPTFRAAIWTAPALASYDPDFLRALFGSGSRLNYPGYRSRAFDHLAAVVATVPDRNARVFALADELRRLARDAPVVPLFFQQGAYAFRPDAYDGWVFVKGTGIFDKRSFLPGARTPRESARERDIPGASGRSGGTIGPLGWVAIALVAVVLGLALAVLRRRPA
jgi:peptide/nickel transport system substrate-binding protein